MTYRVLTFLAYERLEPLLVYVGSALVAFGTRLLQKKSPCRSESFFYERRSSLRGVLD